MVDVFNLDFGKGRTILRKSTRRLLLEWLGFDSEAVFAFTQKKRELNLVCGVAVATNAAVI